MKRFVLIMLSIFTCAIASAEQITINWLNEDKTTNQTTSCTIGGDVILPYTPTKYGYTFQGWRANYTPIEYLESSGTQYIDTGVVPDSAITVQTKVYITSYRNGWNTFFGSNMVNGSGAENFTVAVNNSKFYIGYIGDHATNTSALLKNWYDIELVSNDQQYYLSVDNTIIYSNTHTRYAQTTSPMSLFGVYAKDAGITWIPNIRIGQTKIWKHDILVRDFIPVLDKDGTPCMLDKVEGKFYYNQGTGQFIAGPIINE